MKKIFLLFFFVSSINLIYAQENLTVNLIGNPDFETPIINLISSFDSVSIGKWSFFKCSGSIESAASLSTSMPYSGVNNALINVISNPSNNIWNALLFQDFQNMKPMKYEFSFRAKAGKVLQSGINISIIDKNTNTILKGFSEENFKFNADWGLYIVDLDLSSFKTSDLTNARISFHFSEVADYQIDDVKLRPIYVVPFVKQMEQ
jgi:DNA-binding beta-propeller fold protein YncE